MPRRFDATPEEFSEFDKRMQKLGYLRTTWRELRNEFKEVKFKPSPRKSDGSTETGYIYRDAKTEYASVVWTSWIESEKRFRDEDSGWAIIINEERKKVYDSRGMRRTKNFLENLLAEAKLVRWQVRHRPTCVHCGSYMKIVMGKGMGSRLWQCRRWLHHPTRRRESMSLYDTFPEPTRSQLKKRQRQAYKQVMKYQKKQKALGKNPRRSFQIRRSG